ncbi:hypothetical protein [Lacisediminihabitans profunda]|uniref:Uncharacterized protein n=1 Tax=Lacisediminihabitans profunda TaxID=2594790 RepID=A0A5C8UPI1_9MICO|nr:hypothetical protein [Lacisediminihabitans profunda]TXN30332.1 hypothetical protein FVP33_09960 [Lacisediminihabitans profunda]
MTGASRDEPGFDPRFDPAFQPGYDPTLHGREQRPPVESNVDRSVRTAPLVEPGQPIAVEEESAAAAEPETTSRRPNVFVVALWALSAVFIGTGLYLLRFISDRLDSLNTSGGGGSSDYYLLQAYTMAAPMLIVLGLATATGTLFLFAARSQRGGR